MTSEFLKGTYIIQTQLNFLNKIHMMQNADDGKSSDVFYSGTVEDKGATNWNVENEDEYTSCSETESEYSEYSDHNSVDLRMQELKEFHNQNDEDPSDLEISKNRLRLVKSYAQLKEEMEKTTTKYIANHLYQHKDKLLSGPAHESIHAMKTRSEGVEKLLKRVLMGPHNVYEVFISILRQVDENITERLDSIPLTVKDLKVFLALEKKAESNRISHVGNRSNRKFMKRHRKILEHWLNDKVVVDSINDQFLSRLIFRIDQHSDIADNSKDTKSKLRLLLQTIENCQHNICEIFFEILKLDTIGMGHVVDRLQSRKTSVVRRNEKRKKSGDETLFTTPAKRKIIRNNLCSEKEANIVKTLQTSKGANVKEKLSELDLEYVESSEGSIIIQLIPKSSESLHKLRNSCQTGAIKNFVPEVFRNNVSDLEEGEYLLTFRIFLLPTPPYSHDDKKIIFHLETEESTSIDIEESSKLLCQELEITEKLITKLKDEGLVDDDISQEVFKLPRRKRIQRILDEISVHGVKGYNSLKEYIKTADENLYKQLITNEEARKMSKSVRIGARVGARPTSASQENKKELFYTASLLLGVKKAGVDAKTGETTKDEITCEKIISSKCHFTEGAVVEKYETDSDDEFHSLDGYWWFDKNLQGQKETVPKVDGKRKEMDTLLKIQDGKSSQTDLKKEHDKHVEAEDSSTESPRKYEHHKEKTLTQKLMSEKKMKPSKK